MRVGKTVTPELRGSANTRDDRRAPTHGDLHPNLVWVYRVSCRSLAGDAHSLLRHSQELSIMDTKTLADFVDFDRLDLKRASFSFLRLREEQLKRRAAQGASQGRGKCIHLINDWFELNNAFQQHALDVLFEPEWAADMRILDDETMKEMLVQFFDLD